jgi:endonuclease/exonuclease/phosphatase family metal-dependent hydrolase
MLYMPQQILLLPLAVLVPAALLAEVPAPAWRLMAAGLIIFLWHVAPSMGRDHPSDGRGLKLMTNNYGQNHGLSLGSWIAAQDPDIIALQDATGQGRVFQRAYPGRFVSEAGQFVLVSKAPISSAALLPAPLWRGRPVAALFVVPWHGAALAVYSVHMPTPRGDFAKLAGLGLLREALGRNKARSDGWSFQDAMTARVALAGALAGVLAAEKRPYVIMGDFNMPSDGCVHRIFAARFTDTFIKAGRGFGYTFPGDASNPLAFFMPWLRIDYIFAGPTWRVDSCLVEPGRRSEHRPVVAVLSPV